jgi:hypothetical protein
MNIWSTSSVEKTPKLELGSWSVFEVDGVTRHFVGYNYTEREGRVSSEIKSFDKETRIGVTNSGRNYQLIGEPGSSADGLYTWKYWCILNKVKSVKDVTKEYE